MAAQWEAAQEGDQDADVNTGDAAVARDADTINAGPCLLSAGRAHRILRERCPACFGLEEWGRSLDE